MGRLFQKKTISLLQEDDIGQCQHQRIQKPYLNDKYLRLSYQTRALVSPEHVCDCLNFDLAIMCINMIILTVTQVYTNKAVGIAVVIQRG